MFMVVIQLWLKLFKLNILNINIYIMIMNEELKKSYNDLKKEMRTFLKRNNSHLINKNINSQLISMTDTLRDINNNTFDIETQRKVDALYNKFMPFMINYWMNNELMNEEKEDEIYSSN